MNFESLTPEVRTHMLNEIDADSTADTLYRSKRLLDSAWPAYKTALTEAAKTGTEVTLAAAIANGMLVSQETSTRNGKPYLKAVPSNAAQTLAEGEFNRFYIRGVCLEAIATNRKIEVYRGKAVSSARSESELKLGHRPDPKLLLADLRKNIGLETFLGIPGGANSGISVRLVDG